MNKIVSQYLVGIIYMFIGLEKIYFQIIVRFPSFVIIYPRITSIFCFYRMGEQRVTTLSFP